MRVFMEDEALVLDPNMDYSTVTGLSSEVRERLGVVKPASIVRFCCLYFNFRSLDSSDSAGGSETHGGDDAHGGSGSAEACEADI